jgi:hypothetical protein
MRTTGSLVIALCGLLAAAPVAHAASQTQNVTGTATVAALAKLSLSTSSITFPDADPDTTPSIAPSQGAITIIAKGRTSLGTTVTLTVLASDDFRAGTATILVNNLTWTATGAGFVAGTMSKTAAQTVGSWTDSGNRSGTQSYLLQNSWNYATGTYSLTLAYTLTAP